jgi:hypothetical protein
MPCVCNPLCTLKEAYEAKCACIVDGKGGGEAEDDDGRADGSGEYGRGSVCCEDEKGMG